MKNVPQLLPKSVSIPLEIAAIVAADAGIHKNNLRFGRTTTFVISNHILKMFKFLTNYGLLIKGVSQTILNETKNQRDKFIGMLLGTLGVIFSGIVLVGKGVRKTGNEVIRAGEGPAATS